MHMMSMCACSCVCVCGFVVIMSVCSTVRERCASTSFIRPGPHILKHMGIAVNPPGFSVKLEEARFDQFLEPHQLKVGAVACNSLFAKFSFCRQTARNGMFVKFCFYRQSALFPEIQNFDKKRWRDFIRCLTGCEEMTTIVYTIVLQLCKKNSLNKFDCPANALTD